MVGAKQAAFNNSIGLGISVFAEAEVDEPELESLTPSRWWWRDLFFLLFFLSAGMVVNVVKYGTGVVNVQSKDK